MKNLLSVIKKFILLSDADVIVDNAPLGLVKADVLQLIHLIQKALETSTIKKGVRIGVSLDDPYFTLVGIAVIWDYDAVAVVAPASSFSTLPVSFILSRTHDGVILQTAQEETKIENNEDVALILLGDMQSSRNDELYFTFEQLNAFKHDLGCDHTESILIVADRRFDIMLPLLAKLFERPERHRSIGLVNQESAIAELIHQHQFSNLYCPVSKIVSGNHSYPSLLSLVTWGSSLPRSKYEADLLIGLCKHEHIFGELFPIAKTFLQVQPTSKFPFIYRGNILTIWNAEIVDAEYRSVAKNIVGQLVLKGSQLPDMKYQTYPTHQIARMKLDGTVEFIGSMYQKQMDNELLLEKIQTKINEYANEKISVKLESIIKEQPSLSIASILDNLSNDYRQEIRDASRPSYIKGQPLTVPNMNLADALLYAAKLGNGIRYIDQNGNAHTTAYHELLHKACCLLTKLRQSSISIGSEVIIHVKDQEDLFTGLWCCILGGFVALPLLIPESYSQQEIKLLGWLLGENSILNNKYILTAEECLADLKLFLDQHQLTPDIFTLDDLSENMPVAEGDWTINNEFLLLLTSGSSGTPKGVLLTHQNIIAMSEAIRQTFHYQAQDITLNWLPVDHVGGLVQFHLRDIYLGCQQIHVATQYILKDPLRWLDLLDEYKVSITWCANFAFSLLLEHANRFQHRHWDLSRLHTIMNGGELITPEINHQFLTLLEKSHLKSSVIRPCFGMSETTSCIISANNFKNGCYDNIHWVKFAGSDQPILFCDEDEGTGFIEVGTPTPGVEVRIVDQNNNIYPEGVCGRIQVRGPQIMHGYYNNDKENMRVKTDDGWLKMGDLGFIINGRLVVTGREKMDIIINGRNIAAQEIEKVVEHINGIKPQATAACAVRKADATTDSLAIFFCKDEGADLDELLTKIRSTILENFSIQPAWIIPLSPQELPRTAIGKLKHQELVNRMLAGAYDHIANTDALKKEHANALPNWFFYPDWKSEPLLRLKPVDKTILVIEQADALPLSPHLTAYCKNIVTIASDETLIRNAIIELNPSCVIYNAILQWPSLNADDIPQRFQKNSRAIATITKILRDLDQSHILFNVIANDSLYATGQENSVAQSYFYGFLQSLRQENTSISIKHIDVLKEHIAWESLIADVIHHDQDETIAYRFHLRLVPILKQITASHYLSDIKRSLLVKQGAYVLIGGLGGIGTLLARYLATQYQAKLLLIGRTDIHDNVSSQHYLAWKKIRQYSEDIIYKQIDATNQQALQQCIQEFELTQNVKIKAVFNLVGEGSIATQIENITSDNMSYSFSKIKTALSILYALKDHPAAVVTFSSVNGFFGGAGFKEYAAECSFQDALSLWENNKNQRQTKVIDWSLWLNVGMAKNTPEYMVEMANRRGFSALTKKQGIASFELACRFDHHQIMVGLLLNNAYIFSLVENSQKALFVHLSCRKAVADAIIQHIQNIVGHDVNIEFEEMIIDQNTLSEPEHTELTKPEKMLLHIWQDLFPRKEITIDDNFFSLGGDSIQTIQFVARAHQQGLILKVNDVFTYKTIRHLAQHCLLEQTALTHDEAQTGDLIITPIQAWFFELSVLNRSHFNMSNVFLIPSSTPVDRIEKCLQCMIQHHDIFKARYQPSDHGWTAYYAEQHEDLNLDFIDLTQSTDFQQDFQDVYFKQQRMLDISCGPLVNAVYIWRGPEQNAWLLLTVHHLIIDGVSWRILSEDFSRLLMQAADQKPLSLPNKTASFQSWGRHLSQLAKDPNWVSKKVSFWLAQLQKEWSILPCELMTAPVKEQDLTVYQLTITKEVTNAFVKNKHHAAAISLDHILTTGVLWAIYQWTGKTTCAVDKENHGRFVANAPDVTRTVGWFTAIYPFIVDFEQTFDIQEALLLVKDQFSILKDREFEFGVLNYLADDETKNKISSFSPRQVCFNYLGQFNSKESADATCRWLKDGLSADMCPETQQPYLINIAALMAEGEFILGFKYSPRVYQTGLIEQFANQIVDNITSLILNAAENSDNTIDFALAGINHKQLNSLLEKVEFT